MTKWAVLALLLGSCSLFAAPINVLVGQNKPPYIRLETISGFEIELLREVVKRMGHEAVFIFAPNSRIRSLLESGNGDIATLQEMQNAEPGLFFSQPYIRYQNVVISRAADELAIQHPADLSNKIVVAFQGASRYLGADYRDAMQNNKGYLETIDQKAQVDMLFSGRADAVVMDRNIFLHNQQLSSTHLAVQIDELFKPTFYRAGFVDAGLQHAFDRALLSVVLDDWYRQLQLKYFMQTNQELPLDTLCQCAQQPDAVKIR